MQARDDRRGFFTVDVLMGLAIVGVLAVALLGLLARAGRAARNLSETRAATRNAEAKLAELQAFRPPQPNLEGATPAQSFGLNAPAPPTTSSALDSEPGIRVHREAGGSAPSGYAWVRVIATVAGKSADLVGLVPDGPELRRAQTSAPATIPTTQEAP